MRPSSRDVHLNMRPLVFWAVRLLQSFFIPLLFSSVGRLIIGYQMCESAATLVSSCIVANPISWAAGIFMEQPTATLDNQYLSVELLCLFSL